MKDRLLGEHYIKPGLLMLVQKAGNTYKVEDIHFISGSPEQITLKKCFYDTSSEVFAAIERAKEPPSVLISEA